MAPAARGNEEIASAFIGKKQFFQRPFPAALQSLPFFHRDQDSGFRAAFGNDLGAFLKAGFQQFAEPRLGVLHRPLFHGTST
jgi:hypothetical protein